MNKVLLQFSILIVLFLGTWLLLGQVDFMKHLQIAKITKDTEKKLGDFLMGTIKKRNTENDSDSVVAVLDAIKYRICKDNAIDTADIHIHIIKSDIVNAFAIPGNHVIVYTGLIKHCDSASELTGVLSHEIAHLQLHHVMKRLVSELGIAVIAGVASNGNSVVVSKIIKTLSSTAFQRSQESQADEEGVKYMERAHINPKGFSNIMEKLSVMQSETPKQLQWISSHPDSKARSLTILKLMTAYHTTFIPVLTDSQWQSIKNSTAVYAEQLDDE